MEPHNKKSFDDEDEEDLEALRLAALQSLKRKEEIGPPMTYNTSMGFNRGKGGHKRGRFYGPPHQRINKNSKNGQFNNFNGRVRNSNLIAITPVSEDVPENKDSSLVLPQDRYTGNVPKEDKTNENTTSKFDRYEHSDQSESESEEESAESGNDSPGKLEKADSLEALMQELDDEIQGIKKPKEEVVVPKKKVKKKRKVKTSESESEPVKECVVIEPEVVKVEETQAKENLKPEPQNNFRRRSRSISPKNRPMRKRKRNFYPPSYPMPQQDFPYPPMNYQPPPSFNPVYGPPMNPAIPPPPYVMPLSINTDLTAVTMAPLSPRSARFVLENREIIEKRKRSPRRSYSRSPTPRRRSRSPRRSLSPFPRRQSLSPRRRSHSPKRLHKKEEVSPKSKAPVRERLGLKSPEKKPNSPVKEEEKPLDPVLEARKRKFESNEIKVKEGIIRLKPKDEKAESVETVVQEEKVSEDLNLDDLNEDALLEDDEIDLGGKVDDLFSDEESSSDNEGRFKVKDNSKGEKVPVLPFSKLLNGNKMEIKEKPLIPSRRERSRRDKRRRSRSPVVKNRMKEPEMISKIDEEDKKISPEVARKRIVKSHISPPLDKRFERKIEIKIKNPAKYDKEENSPKSKRKVEIGPKNIVEELEDPLGDVCEEDANANEGDLRAQLSKKRAERLHKNVPMEGTASRLLLQNALQGAVFTKPKKNKDKDLTNDGKLPIHLRLGVANSEPKGRKKSKKSRNRSQEQV